MTAEQQSIASVSLSASEELRKAEAELASFQSMLIDAELQLTTLQQQLEVFAQHYRHMAAGLCGELETLNARIAAILAGRLHEQGFDRDSEPCVDIPPGDSTSGEQPRLPDFAPSASLQSLYREAAKRFHPDLSENDEDHIWRTQMMRQANAAFADGDSDTLRRLLAQQAPVVSTATQANSVLAALYAKIQRVRSRLNTVLQNQRDAENSDVGLLYTQAKKSGLNLTEFLRDLVVTVRAEIYEKRALLRTLLDKESTNGKRA